MKGKSLIAAIFIIVGAITSLVIWQTGNLIKADVDSFTYFKQKDEQLVFQFGQHLFWLNDKNEVTQQLSLNPLKIKVHGDYDFFNNGDVLFYHRAQQPSLLSNLSAYLRLTKTPEYLAEQQQGSEGFYRCNLIALSCNPFGQSLPKMPHSFRLVIDQTDDTIYLAETGAHRLYKIDSTGHILATDQDNHFKYPNQLSFVNQALWLADTNHQRLVQIDKNTDTFAQVQQTIPATFEPNNRWPHQFSFVNNELWVNIANSAMSEGVLQRLDALGVSQGQAKLVHHNDPMTLTFWQNHILVTDFNNASIERLDLRGNSLGLLSLPALAPYINARQQSIDRGEKIASFGIISFAFVLIFGFAAAWLLEKKQTKSQFKKMVTDPTDLAILNAQQYKPSAGQDHAVKHASIFSLTNRAKVHYKKIVTLIILLTVAIVALPLLLIYQYELPLTGMNFLYGALGVVFIEAYLYYLMVEYISTLKLSVQGSTLIIEKSGEKTVTEFSSVYYSSSYLIYKKILIPIGNAQQRYFNKDELSQHIFSQLNPNNKLTAWPLLQKLWQQKEPFFINLLKMLSVMLGFLLWNHLTKI
jgi:hypothetical protein